VCNQYLNGQTVAVDGGYLLHAGTWTGQMEGRTIVDC
jgi:hypothetical protein